MKRDWLLQVFGNALLIFLFYEWLGIRDSRISQIVLSLVLALGIFAGAVFLHSRTFSVRPGRFAIVLLAFLLVWWAISLIPVGKFGQWFASVMTFKSRKPVNPATVVKYLDDARWVIQWLVVPSLLLRMKSTRVFLFFALLVIIGFAAPYAIIHWTPKLESTAAQVTSFVLRFGLAYCLLVTSCVLFARFTSSGRPLASQPSTAALP